MIGFYTFPPLYIVYPPPEITVTCGEACACWIVPFLHWKREGVGCEVLALEETWGREEHCKLKGGRGFRILVQEMKRQVPWVVMGLKFTLWGLACTTLHCAWSRSMRQAHLLLLPQVSFSFPWGVLALCFLFQASAESFLIKMELKERMIRCLILTWHERTPDVSFCLKVRGRKSN